MASIDKEQRLKNQLTCSICLGIYINPKVLQCHHAYCQQCLLGLVKQDPQGYLIIPCPTCRQTSPLPASGVAGLQSDFRINHLLELVVDDKTETELMLSSEEKNSSADPSEDVTLYCSEHAGREIELICETCKEAICYKCIKKGGKHNGHDCEEVDEAIERYVSQKIPSSLETTAKALSQIKKYREKISDQREAIEAEILQTRISENRKTKLIGQLHQLTDDKMAILAGRQDQIETIQRELSGHLHSLQEGLEGLPKKTTKLKQTKELISQFQPDVLAPSTEADMVFVTSDDVPLESESYGKISTSGPPDPSKCHASCIEAAMVGGKCTTILYMLCKDDRPCKESLDYITSEIVSELTGKHEEGCVERKRQNQYEISYQPTIKGRHLLHIKVFNQHIKGSPFLVSVMAPVETLGTPILTVDVERPRGVVIDQKFGVIVTSEYGPCVSLFNSSAERVGSFGMCEPDKATNNYHGVAVDQEGNIYLADNINNCLKKFTRDGTLLASVSPEESEPHLFGGFEIDLFDNFGNDLSDDSFGIACNFIHCKLYWTLSNSDRIQIWDTDLSYVGAFGGKGSGEGQFNGPHHVACGSNGNVYVADRGNDRVQVFTAEGKFLRMFSCSFGPFGIALDSSDRVYVSDWNESVSVFTSEGLFIASFGSMGRNPGEFLCPAGLAVDGSGVVYVCDYVNDRLQLF